MSAVLNGAFKNTFDCVSPAKEYVLKNGEESKMLTKLISNLPYDKGFLFNNVISKSH